MLRISRRLGAISQKTKLNRKINLIGINSKTKIFFSTTHGHNQENGKHDDHGSQINNHEHSNHDEHDEHDDHGHNDPVAHNYFLQKEFYPLHDQRATVYGWDHVLPRQKEKPLFFTPDPNFDSHQWWNEEEDGPAGKNARTRLGQDKPGIANSYPLWLNAFLLATVPLIFFAYWIGPDRRHHKLWYPHAIKTEAELDSFVRAVLQAKKEGRIPDRHTWFDATTLEPIDEYDDTVQPNEKFELVLRKVD